MSKTLYGSMGHALRAGHVGDVDGDKTREQVSKEISSFVLKDRYYTPNMHIQRDIESIASTSKSVKHFKTRLRAYLES